MVILSIDTTEKTLSAAIVSGGECLAESSLLTEATHSERLMPTIDTLITSAGIDIADIDYYACTVGPGSFTGLRIGVSTIKGLAYANGKKVVAVSSLDALCENVERSKYDICPLIDARKGEVYTAFYKKKVSPSPNQCEKQSLIAPPIKGGGQFTKSDEINLTPDELIKRVRRKTLFFGSGAVIYRKALEAGLKDKALFAPNAMNYIDGKNVAKIARELIKKRKAITPDRLVPVYIRKPDVR